MGRCGVGGDGPGGDQIGRAGGLARHEGEKREQEDALAQHPDMMHQNLMRGEVENQGAHAGERVSAVGFPGIWGMRTAETRRSRWDAEFDGKFEVGARRFGKW